MTLERRADDRDIGGRPAGGRLNHQTEPPIRIALLRLRVADDDAIHGEIRRRDEHRVLVTALYDGTRERNRSGDPTVRVHLSADSTPSCQGPGVGKHIADDAAADCHVGSGDEQARRVHALDEQMLQRNRIGGSVHSDTATRRVVHPNTTHEHALGAVHEHAVGLSPVTATP